MQPEILFDPSKQARYKGTEPLWISPEGNLLDLEFEAEFDLKKIANRKPDLWRYREAIPIGHDEHIISMGEGFTPLLPLSFSGKTVWVKQDQLFPSGSYKDRGATVLISKAKALGIKHLMQDSSGNAGCAIAAYAARAGIRCDIYLPASTAETKIKQINASGAQVFRIQGTREDTAIAALQAAQSSYYASHCYNPYFYQGTKTFAYEVCEQLGWKAPDTLILPAGNGTLVLGCYIGFTDLMKAGIIDRMPEIVAIQAANCSPLSDAFHKNEHPASYFPSLAEGIAIAKPVRMMQILEVIRATQGTILTVTEEEIKNSQTLCGHMGFYIEPTAAATIAGVEKFCKGFERKTIVTLFSGHGLKK